MIGWLATTTVPRVLAFTSGGVAWSVFDVKAGVGGGIGPLMRASGVTMRLVSVVGVVGRGRTNVGYEVRCKVGGGWWCLWAMEQRCEWVTENVPIHSPDCLSTKDNSWPRFLNDWAQKHIGEIGLPLWLNSSM